MATATSTSGARRNSTPWLTDIIWAAARRLGHSATSSPRRTPIEDDHLPFLQAGVPAVDIIDLDYPAWHTAADTLENVSAQSLQIVGDVVLAALPEIEQRLLKQVVGTRVRPVRQSTANVPRASVQ